jgi:hypothetical protein
MQVSYRPITDTAFYYFLGMLVHPNVPADVDHPIANNSLREQRA